MSPSTVAAMASRPTEIDSNLIYQPSPWGQRYHALPYNEVLGGGSAGVGKSVVLLWDPLPQIKLEHDRCARAIDHEHPLAWGESKGWALHLRRTYKELGTTIQRSLLAFPKIDPGAKFIKDSEIMGLGWIFSSGFKYQFGHCMDPDDWINFQSFEYTWIGFDELVTFLEPQYEGIRTRLRTDDPLLMHMLKVRSMSNPVVARQEGDKYLVRDPLWVRRRFVDPAPLGNVVLTENLKRKDGRVIQHKRFYLPGRLTDNPNKEFQDKYEADLLSQKKYNRAAYLDGDWYAIKGAYFDEWDKDIHICKEFKVPPHWKCFRSCDWGYKARGVVHWWAMDEDENLWCIKEYSFKRQRVAEVSGAIQAIEEGLGLWDKKKNRSRCSGPADDQLWERRGDEGRAKNEEFMDYGIDWVQADKRSRKGNYQRVAHRLADHDNKTTTPGLVIFSCCTSAIKTLPVIVAAPGDPEEPLDGGDDHDADSFGYACAYASRGRGGIAFETEHDEWWGSDDAVKKPGSLRRGSYSY